MAGPAATGCASRAREVTAPPPLVTLHRAGGIAGVDDRLRVTPAGAVTVRHRAGSPVRFTLRRAQLRALRRDLAGFRRRRSRYGPSRPVQDAFVYVITAGDHTVTIRDDPRLPPRLHALLGRLTRLLGHR
jgi:hypothetical protein